MPVLKHPKEELFCQARAAGHTQIDAYRIAGGKVDFPSGANPANPALLDKQERIQTRIKELLSEKAQKTVENAVVITRETLVAELWAIKQKALSAENPRYSDAVNALKEIAILSGFRVEKVDQTTHSDVDDMSKADVQKLVDYVPGQKLHN